MKLTVNTINDILQTGEVINTEIAKKFGAKVYSETGIRIVACYLQSGTHLYLPQGKTIINLLENNNIQFVNEAILTIYIHRINSKVFLDEKIEKDKIFSCFNELLKQENMVIDYPRNFLPEEMEYYGWYSTPKNKWNMSKIIPIGDIKTSNFLINIEYIDRLAMWKYMSENLQYVNEHPFLKNLGAKVYCGCDDNAFQLKYYVILPSYTMNVANEKNIYNFFLSDVIDYLKSKDNFGVISKETVNVIVTKWESLTQKEKFNLQRN